MEKIQQAIERARQHRASLGGRVAAPRTTKTGAPNTGVGEALQAARVVSPTVEHLRDHRVVAALPGDPLGDVVRKLRTQALLRLQTLKGRSVAVVSPRDGEGKSFVACNLAVAIADQTGGPTFLIEMDFRRPSLHKVFGLEPGPSFSDVIEGTAPVDAALVRLARTQLYMLPQFRKHERASELIASDRVRTVVRDLLAVSPAAKIVVDCPPLLLTDEPLIVQGIVDGCLLVVEQGRTTRDDVQRASEYLDEAKYLGSVLNRCAGEDAASYYGYR